MPCDSFEGHYTIKYKSSHLTTENATEIHPAGYSIGTTQYCACRLGQQVEIHLQSHPAISHA